MIISLFSLDREQQSLRAMITSRPELYLDEYQSWLFQITGKSLSIPSLCRYVLRLAFTRRKLSIIAYERDMYLRAEHIRFMSQFPSRMFLFVDECSKDDRKTNRHFGYFQHGYTQPSVLGHFIRKHRISVLAGLSSGGIEGIEVMEGAYNTDLFNFAFRNFLLDRVGSFADMEDCSIVVLDNCRIHDSDDFIEMVHSQGGIVHFLPPSPDFMPIELAFNFVKNWLGRNRSYAEQNSKLAVVKALQAISSMDAENFLATCGYF